MHVSYFSLLEKVLCLLPLLLFQESIMMEDMMNQTSQLLNFNGTFVYAIVCRYLIDGFNSVVVLTVSV